MKNLFISVLIINNFGILLNSENQVYEKKTTIFDSFSNLYLSKFEFSDKNDEKNVKSLSDGDLRKTALELFQADEAKKAYIYPNILSKSFIKDIELFSGELFKKLNNTLTIPGELELAKMLVTPTSDINQLMQRQKLVAKLISDKNLCNKIESSLKKFNENQARFFELSSQATEQQKNILSQFYSKKERLNSSVGYLNIAYYMRALTNILIPSGIIYGINWIADYTNKHDKEGCPDLIILCNKDIEFYKNDTLALDKTASDYNTQLSNNNTAITNIENTRDRYQKILARSNFGTIKKYANEHREVQIGLAFAAGIILVNIMGLIDSKHKLENINLLREQLVPIKTCLDTMKEVYDIASKIEGIKINIPDLENIRILLKESQKKSAQLKKLIDLLNSSTFSGKAQLISNVGRILVAYKLMREINEQFTEAVRAFGKVDAFLSIAKLYKKYENENVKFCFATYADQPTVNIQNFHHPVIDPNVVVTNNIQLGGEHGIRDAIITGPNAGGKSTVLKSVLTCLLLAQTIGIVPAETALISPFDKLCSYMNITDDIAAGNSLFMAEAIRAIELQKTITTGQKVFVASDEMFTGTDPVEGTAAAYAFAEEVAKYNNCIMMLSTHYPLLTKLENTTPSCKNYKVKVNKIEEGSISYPFKLENGTADQKIAIDILRIKGLESNMLERAKQIIEDCKNGTNIFAIA